MGWNLRRLALPIAAGMTFTLGACAHGTATAASDTGSGHVTISYMNFISSGGHEKDLDAIKAAFEKANPDITVNIQTVPYSDYFTKLQTAVAGGTAPDSFDLDYQDFITYQSSGSIAPVTGVDGSVYKKSLLDSFAVGGKQYGLPESFSDVVLFYNKALFDKAGLSYPTSSWTWADEMAAAKKLTDKSAGVWGDYQPISFYEFYKTLAQAGGQFLAADGKSATFDTSQGQAAAQFLVGKSGVTMPTAAQGAGTPDFDTKLFTDGKLAMWHTGIWMFSALDKVPFGWDIAVEPGDTQQASAAFSNAAVVSATSKNQAAATKWITFLTSSDTEVQTRLSTGWEIPAISDQSKLNAYMTAGKPDNRQAVFDALNNVVNPPVIVKEQQMQDAVNNELTAAAAGRKSVNAALTDAQKAVNALLP